MRLFTALIMAITSIPFTASANGPLSEHLWVSRPVVIFAPSAEDPRLIQQLEWLELEAEAMEERDVVVVVDTDPDGESDLRKKYRPRGFTLLLVGKDGQVKLRKPFPWDVRELSRAIDKMPMRKQELRAARP